MEALNSLYDLVELELKKISKKETLTVPDIDAATKAVCLLEKIQNLQNGSIDDGYSGRRSRSSVTGRFMSSNGRYRNGYSGHSIKDRMVDKLESMMDEAGSDYERQTIAEWISKIRE